MSTPIPIDTIANLIMSMNAKELAYLRKLLADATGGDETSVGALIPPNLPLKEGGAEVELPEDYWETAQ